MRQTNSSMFYGSETVREGKVEFIFVCLYTFNNRRFINWWDYSWFTAINWCDSSYNTYKEVCLKLLFGRECANLLNDLNLQD